MRYDIKIKPSALKELKKLPKELAERIMRKLVFVSDTPQSFMKKLESENVWSLRIGNYRILIDIYEDKKLIEILKVGHRKDVYKRL